MTVDALAREIVRYLKLAIGLCLLFVVAITAIELIGIDVPGFNGIKLTQATGIGMAGLGFLYGKLTVVDLFGPKQPGK
jgi:hypothetical protein